MYWIYFLYSKATKNVYIGCTKNLEKRLKKHQGGLVKSTINRRPLVLIYKEKYGTLSIARRREEYLKSLYGYRARNKILKEFLNRR